MNLKTSWELKVRDKVFKTLAKFPKKERAHLIETIEALPSGPYIGDIEKMRGEENTWRRRIGAYRIFYEIRMPEQVIYVYGIERRTSKTY